MKISILHIIRRSLAYHRTGVLYQFLIIILLSAVITGSLMTGSSVKTSLKELSAERLGKTGILISSGIRYFDPSLAERMSSKTGLKCTGILEMEGFCRNFYSGETASGVKIFATDEEFLNFHNIDGIRITRGEAAVNEKLANYLGLEAGDEIIISFNSVSELPGDAPFAPEKKGTGSIVLKVGTILNPDQSGNFSLNISQITPLNIFINRNDLTDSKGRVPKINRLLIESKNGISESETYKHLSGLLTPEDIGLSLRLVPKTGGIEIISERIFIDQLIIDEIRRQLPSSYPVLTYLGNSFSTGTRSTPYSFISALPPSLYPEIPEGNRIILTDWIASDLGVKEADTIMVTWYSPDPSNRLVEIDNKFTVSQIVDMKSLWSDSLLMPEFPGIAGSESCSDWDAGVSIRMDRIRQKDEDYWNLYRGTPKAFISYKKGEELWGNNFGPATSIRFSSGIAEDEIRLRLTGTLDPFKAGFFITDMRRHSSKAASESVDFSTLFLSLGFFIILSAAILMILVVSIFFQSKEKQISTLYSLGFTGKWIERLLMQETGFIAFAGAMIGAFTGFLLNLILIKSLNTVWQGAVQTDTLNARFDLIPLISGFLVSFAIIVIILRIKSKLFLKELNKPETGILKKPSSDRNSWLMFISFFLAITTLILSFLIHDYASSLSFSGGILMYISLVFLLRYYYLKSPENKKQSFRKIGILSRLYYSFNPFHAITPAVFIAAGLFAVVITGVNKMSISSNMLKPSGGTGGFILWGESTVPVRENLNSDKGRKEFGLDENELESLSFVQARRLQGDDASCLNLNHVASPPLLGLNPSFFISKGSFSFAAKVKDLNTVNPWESLSYAPANGTAYGIVDQTVLQWGLKKKIGDTLIVWSENGQQINIIISAGLKSSLFQGYVIIGDENFSRFFPSVSGSEVFLVDGRSELSDYYNEILTDRLSTFGARFEPASERLASFFVVTNTYLSVFSILGLIGMVLGVIGLGFILIRNFNQRKREFGLMMATGYSLKDIRGIIFMEQFRILLSGMLIGLISAFLATMPSVISGSEIPWINIVLMFILIVSAGLAALYISLKTIRSESLISNIRKE